MRFNNPFKPPVRLLHQLHLVDEILTKSGCCQTSTKYRHNHVTKMNHVTMYQLARNSGVINAVKNQFSNIRERVAWICKHHKCVYVTIVIVLHVLVLFYHVIPSTTPRATAVEATGLTATRYQTESLQGEQDDLNTRRGPMTRSSGLNITMQQEHAEAEGGLQLMTDWQIDDVRLKSPTTTRWTPCM